jgi:hypothetical protein
MTFVFEPSADLVQPLKRLPRRFGGTSLLSKARIASGQANTHSGSSAELK